MFLYFENNSSKGRVTRYILQMRKYLLNTSTCNNTSFDAKEWRRHLSKDNSTDGHFKYVRPMYRSEFTIFAKLKPSFGESQMYVTRDHDPVLDSPGWLRSLGDVGQMHIAYKNKASLRSSGMWHIPCKINDQFGPFYKMFSPFLQYARLYREYLSIMLGASTPW